MVAKVCENDRHFIDHFQLVPTLMPSSGVNTSGEISGSTTRISSPCKLVTEQKRGGSTFELSDVVIDFLVYATAGCASFLPRQGRHQGWLKFYENIKITKLL